MCKKRCVKCPGQECSKLEEDSSGDLSPKSLQKSLPWKRMHWSLPKGLAPSHNLKVARWPCAVRTCKSRKGLLRSRLARRDSEIRKVCRSGGVNRPSPCNLRQSQEVTGRRRQLALRVRRLDDQGQCEALQLLAGHILKTTASSKH